MWHVRFSEFLVLALNSGGRVGGRGHDRVAGDGLRVRDGRDVVVDVALAKWVGKHRFSALLRGLGVEEDVHAARGAAAEDLIELLVPGDGDHRGGVGGDGVGFFGAESGG